MIDYEHKLVDGGHASGACVRPGLAPSLWRRRAGRWQTGSVSKSSRNRVGGLLRLCRGAALVQSWTAGRARALKRGPVRRVRSSSARCARDPSSRLVVLGAVREPDTTTRQAVCKILVIQGSRGYVGQQTRNCERIVFSNALNGRCSAPLAPEWAWSPAGGWLRYRTGATRVVDMPAVQGAVWESNPNQGMSNASSMRLSRTPTDST